jgi:hypothetical protein
MNNEYDTIESCDEATPVLGRGQDGMKKKGFAPLVVLTALVLGLAFYAGQYRGAAVALVANNNSFEDVCLSKDLTHEQAGELFKFLDDEYVTPYWAGKGKAFDEKFVHPPTPALPSVVENLSNDYVTPAGETCAQVDFSAFNIVTHDGEICYSDDSISVIYRRCISILGNQVECNTQSIGGNTQLTMGPYYEPTGTISLTLYVNVNDGWMDQCVKKTYWGGWWDDEHYCAGRVEW